MSSSVVPVPATAPVVNLCFHGIGTPGRVLEPDEERYWVEAAQFDELLAVIARSPSLRLTFDDGNASDASVALPALRERGLRAEFFVVAGRIGRPGSLSEADLRELARNGMTIGSHGMRHRPWRGLRGEDLREELVDAPGLIADAASAHVERASCPFGAYDRRVLDALRRRGFERVYTVDGGPARPDAWLQSRHTITSGDTPLTLEQLARGAHGGLATATARSLKTAMKRWR